MGEGWMDSQGDCRRKWLDPEAWILKRHSRVGESLLCEEC